ncbi:Protein of unknown function [Pyronema omphalodes CBS 100304]|uniref:Uncharacterized protein n=1 Tax=Pyronema omphalodes (strain CBS 100304) TaxID=1076935 RepID=U4LMS2_PYROM|nr:Protein of unknown function [Pyronema omphalodes CBS 100304]
MPTHRPDPFSSYRRAIRLNNPFNPLHLFLSRHPQPPNLRHGEDGQVFTETILRPLQSWSYLYEPSPIPFPVSSGIPSLSLSCRKILNIHLPSLPLEALLAIPYHPLGEAIYEDAVVTQRNTLRLWCLYSTAYPEFLRSVSYSIGEFRCGFLRELPGVDMGRWVVKLDLVTERIQGNEVRGLGELGCLVEVRLRAKDIRATEVDDGAVRGWVRARKWGRVRWVGLIGYKGITERGWGYLHSLEGLRGLELEKGVLPGKGWRAWVDKDEEMELKDQDQIPNVCEMKMDLLEFREKKKDTVIQRWVKVEMPKLEVEKKETIVATKKGPPVMRKRRMVDMGDLLGQFGPRKR